MSKDRRASYFEGLLLREVSMEGVQQTELTCSSGSIVGGSGATKHGGE